MSEGGGILNFQNRVVDSLKIQGQIKKCLTHDSQAVIVALEAKDLIAEALTVQKASPAAILHLGYGLMSCLLVAALPDTHDEESLEFQWKNSGPFGSLFVEGGTGGRVRGTIGNANPVESQTELEIPMGEGLLQVRRKKKVFTTGITESKGNVLLDVLEYLEKSEQRMCSMNLWIDLGITSENGIDKLTVKNALGFLVHVVGGHHQAQVSDALLYQWDSHLVSLGKMSEWILGPDPTTDILRFISGEYKPRVIDSYPVSSFCSCSRERAERALDLVKKLDEKSGIEALKGQQEVKCEFCGREFRIES